MNPRQVTLRLLLSAIAVAQASHALGAGSVIYKEFAFDPDSQAEMTDYTTYEQYGPVDNVHTAAGQTLRITPGQAPVYIPQPGSPGKTAAEVLPAIDEAKRRFPQFTARLNAYRSAWAALPRGTPLPRATPTPEAAAIAATTATPAAADDSTVTSNPNPLHTRTGAVFNAWSVSSMDGNYVIIAHADGITRVAIMDLPDNLAGFPQSVVVRAQLLKRQEQDAEETDLDNAIARTAGLPGKKQGKPSPSPSAIGH